MADNTGKRVEIDGNVVGELFACFENADDVVAALRARMEYAGLSFGTVEVLAKLPEGAIGKYLSPLQARRLSIASLTRIGTPLGLRCLIYVDAALTRKMRPLWTKRDGGKARANRQVQIGQVQLRRLLRPVAAEMGRRGGVARMSKLSAEQRRAIGLLGAQARWHKQPEAIAPVMAEAPPS